MKWTANVQVYGVTPEDGSPLSIFPIEADSEMDAARSAANSTALALFGESGQSGFLNQTEPHLYIATVGVYVGGGLTRGRSAQILIREYHGVQ